jgi:3-methyl-2-oxobutanoate hydroxymethyltransferase
VNIFGGDKLQGRDPAAARRLVADAQALAESGIFALVLECIPEDVAARVTSAISVPTIGIGAGVHCDGQVLVLHDLLGINTQFHPRFVKQYARLGDAIRQAVAQYAQEVREEKFPTPEHSFVSDEASAQTPSRPIQK